MARCIGNRNRREENGSESHTRILSAIGGLAKEEKPGDWRPHRMGRHIS